MWYNPPRFRFSVFAAISENVLLDLLPTFFHFNHTAGAVDGRAVSAAACHTGGPGSIPGPSQTYV
jgi:hypothetical protein